MQNVIVLYAHLGDNELILQINSGNKTCFEILIRRHNPALFRVGKTYGFSDEDVEDLVHDTQMQAFCGLKGYDSKMSYRVWLTRQMIDKCREKISLHSRNYEYSSDYQGPAAAAGDHFQLRPEHQYQSPGIFAHGERQGSIEYLPVSLRSIYILREVEGFSVSETAKVMELSEANVKLQESQAKSLLYKPFRRLRHTDVYTLQVHKNDKVVRRVMNRI